MKDNYTTLFTNYYYLIVHMNYVCDTYLHIKPDSGAGYGTDLTEHKK